MDFKIDTKESFTIIMPDAGRISANMTDALLDKWEEVRQSGSNNFIIDLTNCAEVDISAITSLVDMHEKSYSGDSSLVFTGISNQILAVLKSEEADLILNIAPQMQEAIDIISMEILERDLLSEE